MPKIFNPPKLASKTKLIFARCVLALRVVCSCIFSIFNVILSKTLKFFVIIYQKSFSLAIGRSCRFYPSCSNYALWLFDFNKPFKAVLKITHRIFMCNPLSSGGIDYPTLEISICPIFFTANPQQKRIKYWLLPYKNSLFLATISYPKRVKGTFVIIKSF